MITKEEFRKEVNEIAEKINVETKEIRIRTKMRKLGSCSPNSIITFSSSVLEMEYKLRMELIIHELLHLRYKNHGKLFKTMLKTYLELLA